MGGAVVAIELYACVDKTPSGGWVLCERQPFKMLFCGRYALVRRESDKFERFRMILRVATRALLVDLPQHQL
eukprot:CAMPEP_0171978226 /NCGR_PEP_ID=MMETSP0993-20121228/250869_1 /TAXON_ID=483369 /ORGANISM="non described non described, Strain CCMP2098" /LENGTH=71 /DNA_ID=CAMNT_0012630109 /DNA_START=8 /DNA_END=223 /DNA_ORIENTATION=-